MALAIKRKKRILIISLFALICIALFLHWWINQRKGLYVTPSSHKQIAFLQADQKKLGADYRIAFAYYDRECRYVEICVKDTLDEAKSIRGRNHDITIAINGLERGSYDQVFSSIGRQRYVIFLLDEVEEGSTITFAYRDNIVTMTP